MKGENAHQPLRFIRENPCSSVAKKTPLTDRHPWPTTPLIRVHSWFKTPLHSCPFVVQNTPPFVSIRGSKRPRIRVHSWFKNHPRIRVHSWFKPSVAHPQKTRGGHHCPPPANTLKLAVSTRQPRVNSGKRTISPPRIADSCAQIPTHVQFAEVTAFGRGSRSSTRALSIS